MVWINKATGLKSWARKDPNAKPKFKNGWTENSDFYNESAWRNCRKGYADANPLCEASRAEHKYRAAKDIDHIIPVRYGGALYHHANLMGLTEYFHRRKTALETKTDRPLIDYIETDDGLIPKNRQDIFKLLIRNYDTQRS